MRRSKQAGPIIVVLLALAMASAACARPPTPAERAQIGRYYVGDGLDRRLCAITLSFEPTVGGEVQASGCAARAPEIDRSIRWWINRDGGPTFADPLRKITVEFADSEGGLIANLGHGRVLTLAPYDQAFLTHPGAALPGRWAYENDGGDDPTGGCAVRFMGDGGVTVASRCPLPLRNANGGRWQASAVSVTLSKGVYRLALAWGATRDSLFPPGGAFRLVRQP